MAGPIRNMIHNFVHRHDSPCVPPPNNCNSQYGQAVYFVEAPQIVVCPPANLTFPQASTTATPVDDSNKLGASTIRVSSSSGRWQKVGLEVDLPVNERPNFIFAGKASDEAREKTQGTPLDGSYSIEDNHIRVERILLDDGKRARYTVYYHQAGRGVWDTNTGHYHDGPNAGAGSDKDLIVVTNDGTRHLLRLQGEALQTPVKPKTEPLAPKAESTPPAPSKPNPPVPVEKPADPTLGRKKVENPIPIIPDEQPTPPKAQPKPSDLPVLPVPELKPPLGEPPIAKLLPTVDGVLGTTPPGGSTTPLPTPPQIATLPPPLVASPPTTPESKTNPTSPQLPQTVGAGDFGEIAAQRFIRSQFSEFDFTTFHSDDKRNLLKTITSAEALALPAQDAERIEKMLEKTKMKTLPVGSVLEHRLSDSRHRMVLRKFSEDVYVLDTVDIHKAEKGDDEGMKAETTGFVRSKSGKWFAVSATRLVSSYIPTGGSGPGLSAPVRTRLTWLGNGADEMKGHILKPYVPERPNFGNFLAPRSSEDPVVNRVPTHALPFTPVTPGTKGVAEHLPEKFERVLALLDKKIPKVGGHVLYEQCWAHAIAVDRIDENCFVIGTHSQLTTKSGTAHNYDVMLVRKMKDGTGWEVAQLEFNGTDFVAVAEPVRHLAKDARYDMRFSMLENGLNGKR